MRNRGIGRARMFMGGLLLLAAALTWGIILTVSPHGQAIASGTDYVRSTILTFKRNGAIGTLILSALAAWLLFPRRRPKWPVRDWSLFAILALLGGTSLYTLISLQRLTEPGTALDASRSSGDVDMEWNAPQPESQLNSMDMSAAPPPIPNDLATAPMTAGTSAEREALRIHKQAQEGAESESNREATDASSAVTPSANEVQMTNNDVEQNQD